MKKKNKSQDVAQALSRKVLEDIGRQFCRRNLERSVNRQIQREQYILRLLQTEKMTCKGFSY